VGSPQWSAILAIADQKAAHNLGFINKALHHIGQAPPHYAATGLGSPDTANLVSWLIQLVSPGDGQSAIAQSANTNGNAKAPGH
jgi:hypothetical protein